MSERVNVTGIDVSGYMVKDAPSDSHFIVTYWGLSPSASIPAITERNTSFPTVRRLDCGAVPH